MIMNLMTNDKNLKESFKLLLSNDNLSSTNKLIALSIADYGLDTNILTDFLNKHSINRIENLKNDTSILLLAYINLILEDHIISEQEAGHIKLLKRYFRIREGELYQHHRNMVVYLLKKQITAIYEDDKIDTNEALHKVNLQELFDLGYDQFLEIVNVEVRVSLSRGGDIEDLDTFLKNYK
jgi:hypothetical protein